jgi:hypothetical protein
MMPPGKADLAIYQGDDYLLDATFTAGGNPVNLTGHTFRAQIRPTTADADSGGPPLATFVVTMVDAVAGHLRISLDHDTTEALPATSAKWDLEGADAGGRITTYLAGAVTVTQEVTRI